MPLLSADEQELRKRFASLTDRKSVAAMIEMSYTRLAYVIYKLEPDARYRTFFVVKRRGGVRKLSEPVRTLKIVQQRLNQVLQAVYLPKPSTHGFVRHRSVVSNAQVHVGKNYVFNVDIESFFPSINFGRVRGIFMAYPYSRNEEVATLLAQICCSANQLPQGAPTSPVVANIICAKMDAELQRLARHYHCSYTRYADDITFSTSHRRFPTGIGSVDRSQDEPTARVGSELERLISKNGFAINASKVRLQDKYRRQEVTGLVVNRFPNTTRLYVREIRAMLHAWDRHGLALAQAEYSTKGFDKKDRGGYDREIAFKDVVKGRIDYLSMVRGLTNPIVQRFYREYLRMAPGSRVPLMAPQTPSDISRIQDALWVLECEESQTQGTAFMLAGHGLITCDHVLGPQTMAFKPENMAAKYPVTVIQRSSAFDIAVLSIRAPNMQCLRRGSSAELVQRSSVCVAGFPNFRPGDTDWISYGAVTGNRTISTVRRILIDTPIIAGASGGPVMNTRNEVVGIAVTGADRMELAGETVHHGVIPIETLDRLEG